MVVVGQLELWWSQGQWKEFGRTVVLWSSSAASKAKMHWKEPWQILLRRDEGEAYQRDAMCMQKVKRVFSSVRRGRWGGWKSRWWQRGRAERVPSLKLQPRTTYYQLFWLLLPFLFHIQEMKIFNSYTPLEKKASLYAIRMQCAKSWPFCLVGNHMCPSNALLTTEREDRGTAVRAVLRCTEQKAPFQCPFQKVQVTRSNPGSLKGEGVPWVLSIN